jgi:hypothetical protein
MQIADVVEKEGRAKREIIHVTFVDLPPRITRKQASQSKISGKPPNKFGEEPEQSRRQAADWTPLRVSSRGASASFDQR